MDRGGLVHISDTMYSLFAAMEMETRSLLHHHAITEGIKHKLTEQICKNEDVLFHWATIACNWEENEADALLHMLVDHWVTIRGYSFASSYVERYKQKNKKTVQKSKGLRKNLLN